MTGVQVRVLGGRWVWPHAFYELAAASDRRGFVAQRLAGADFRPEGLGPRTAGAGFLARVLRGDDVNWGTGDVPPGEVDRVLAALGLYHVRVRCVIPEELGGQYERAVSAAARRGGFCLIVANKPRLSMQMLWWGVDETLAELFARHPSSGSFAGNSRRRFRAVIDGRAYGPSRTPRSIGLYGSRHTVEFRPGE